MFYPTIMVIAFLVMEQQQDDLRHFTRLARNMIWDNCSLITVYVEGDIVLPLCFINLRYWCGEVNSFHVSLVLFWIAVWVVEIILAGNKADLKALHNFCTIAVVLSPKKASISSADNVAY